MRYLRSMFACTSGGRTLSDDEHGGGHNKAVSHNNSQNGVAGSRQSNAPPLQTTPPVMRINGIALPHQFQDGGGMDEQKLPFPRVGMNGQLLPFPPFGMNEQPFPPFVPLTLPVVQVQGNDRSYRFCNGGGGGVSDSFPAGGSVNKPLESKPGPQAINSTTNPSASSSSKCLSVGTGGAANTQPVIGIDLGTSYCCVAVSRGLEDIEIVPNEVGFRITPSCVAFTDRERLVGDAAKKYGGTHPEQCVFEVKRLIGRSFHDPSVHEDAKMWPFQVLPGARSEVLVGVPKVPKSDDDPQMQKTAFRPEEISAMLLKKMKKIAEDFTGGTTITDAVITVPAYFNDSQRQATRRAGVSAGLNVLRLMNEPTAAALAYGHKRLKGRGCDGRKILVFDLGGGTFDVSIITVHGGDNEDAKFLVNAVAGDAHLGGADMDNRLVRLVAEKFRRDNGEDVDVLGNPKVLARVKRVVVEAKHALSAQIETTIDVDYGDKTLSMRLGRAEFEELNKDLFDKCMRITEQALQSAKTSRDDISDIVLAGGSTRIPFVHDMLREFFGKAPLKTIHPDEAVALGAAVQAAILANSHKCDEAPSPHVSVRDVTAFSIGTDTEMNIMAVIIPRNSLLPAKGWADFYFSSDYQTSMDFNIFEGERALCSGNRFLGQFALRGFTPVPANGKPVSRLLLTIDEDGILDAIAEATDNHRELGMREGIKVQTGSGTLVRDGAHAMAAIAATAMDGYTPEAEREDLAIREAFGSRRRLQNLALATRQNFHPLYAPVSVQMANAVLNWLPTQTTLLRAQDYERAIAQLDAVLGS